MPKKGYPVVQQMICREGSFSLGKLARENVKDRESRLHATDPRSFQKRARCLLAPKALLMGDSTMTDSLKDRVPKDPSSIDINEERELRYWCDQFQCKPDELRVAVDAVGTSVQDVRIYLGKERRPV